MRAVLISSCGAGTYRLMKDVLTPQVPSAVTFEEIVRTMTTYFQPYPSDIMQRYCINTRVHHSHDSVATYLARLKQLAQCCKFGDTLQQMLGNRLVCGIGEECWQKCLLSKQALTYDKAVKGCPGSRNS